jgi:hypothetical protein
MHTAAAPSQRRADSGFEMTRIVSAAKELLLADPRRKREVQFHGPTMEPFLRDGDRLSLRPIGCHRLHPGDIVTFRFKDKFPTCRVARVTDEGIVLTADRWPDFNVTVRVEDIVGKVVRKTRAGRELSCDDWAWRLYSVFARVRETIRSIQPVVRRKRERFVLGEPRRDP